jgi:transcriptional regulator GlxA family with amidase domain
VQLAEQLEDHTPLQLLCVELAIPERSLNALCQQQLGMSPGRYMRLRRMANARRTLCAPAPGDTVTGIATRFGFTELGKFSQAYRTVYGERPIDTLNRARSGKEQG